MIDGGVEFHRASKYLEIAGWTCHGLRACGGTDAF
jgi:hypothetical protein